MEPGKGNYGDATELLRAVLGADLVYLVVLGGAQGDGGALSVASSGRNPPKRVAFMLRALADDLDKTNISHPKTPEE